VIVSNSSSKLLLIEDNQFFAMVTQQVLEDQGHRCTVVALMEQAFDFCKSEHFDLCICDYNIPDSNGFASIRLLKRLAGVPVLLISGEQNPYDLSRLKREKIIDKFIQKPFTKELITTTVNQLIL
jgi:CheY-like chemotaxis protein